MHLVGLLHTWYSHIERAIKFWKTRKVAVMVYYLTCLLALRKFEIISVFQMKIVKILMDV
jgi:hypothetical protein